MGRQNGYCIGVDRTDATRLTVGDTVTHRGRTWGDGTVLMVAPFRGLDGRHWVLVRFGTWTFHAELEDLDLVAPLSA